MKSLQLSASLNVLIRSPIIFFGATDEQLCHQNAGRERPALIGGLPRYTLGRVYNVFLISRLHVNGCSDITVIRSRWHVPGR